MNVLIFHQKLENYDASKDHYFFHTTKYTVCDAYETGFGSSAKPSVFSQRPEIL